MPHGHCFFWKPESLWLQVLSNGLVALAYFSIPLMLAHFIRRRRDLPFHWVFHLFAGFIFWCGVTHVMDIVTLWVPLYRLDVVFRLITATISVVTAIALFPLIPQALALRSPRELEAKNRELEEAYAKVKESERLKDQFFAHISHEFRTPLTLILSPLESRLTEKPDAMLQVMHNHAIRLLQMINSLLDFAKLEAGKTTVRREPVDLGALTRSLFDDFVPLIHGRKQHAVLIAPEMPVWVEMDRYLYERILFNLLSNASKFTPDGGRIEVRLTREGDRVRIAVKDSGIGIPASELSTIRAPAVSRAPESASLSRCKSRGCLAAISG
jgi:signal transduction histidine kinase